jgi:hydrogenase-4 component F
MKYEGEEEEKTVYSSELFALVIFAISLITLLLPQTLAFLHSII